MIFFLISILVSCTTVRVTPYVEIPSLETEIEKPVLDKIPSLDVSDMTDKQIESIQAVLAVYNANLGKLVIYTESLESVIELQRQYIEQIKTILNER